MDLFDIARILAIFAAIYGALSAIRWVGLVVVEPRGARRQGLILNLARRSAPPVIAGLILLIASLVVVIIGAGAFGALLIAGGLAFGLHKGLDELRQNARQVVLLRLAVTLGLGLAVSWQLGWL